MIHNKVVLIVGPWESIKTINSIVVKFAEKYIMHYSNWKLKTWNGYTNASAKLT